MKRFRLTIGPIKKDNWIYLEKTVNIQGLIHELNQYNNTRIVVTPINKSSKKL